MTPEIEAFNDKFERISDLRKAIKENCSMPEVDELYKIAQQALLKKLELDALNRIAKDALDGKILKPIQ